MACVVASEHRTGIGISKHFANLKKANIPLSYFLCARTFCFLTAVFCVGTMLAVGLLSPLSQVDRQLTEFSESYFGWNGGLILSGTIALLVYAYITRFLTVAYNATESGMSQIPPSYYEAARTMGASPLRVIGKIQIPLLRRSIVTALLLVFVDTMRELPATLLLRPFNFETLATSVYRLAGDERLAEASTAALCIVALGLLPVLLVTRQNRQ